LAGFCLFQKILWLMPNTLARPPRRPGESFSFSLRRSTAVGIFISLLVHVVAFFLVMPEIAKRERELTAPPSSNPLTARLRLPAATEAPAAPVEPTPPVATPTPPRPQPQRRQRPAPSRAPVLTQRGPSSRSAPAEPAKPEFKNTPLPAPFPTPPNDESPDFSAATKQSQAEREAREKRDGESAGGNATPKAPDVDSIIAKNLARREEESGIFSIRNKGIRTAEIFLRSWTDDPRKAKGELFHVDAGLNGNVEEAIVAQVIAVIRQRYPEGEFQWESFRLHKVLTMSSRKRDSAYLTEFLKKELFSAE
jgi:hypothetical protein